MSHRTTALQSLARRMQRNNRVDAPMPMCMCAFLSQLLEAWLCAATSIPGCGLAHWPWRMDAFFPDVSAQPVSFRGRIAGSRSGNETCALPDGDTRPCVERGGSPRCPVGRLARYENPRVTTMSAILLFPSAVKPRPVCSSSSTDSSAHPPLQIGSAHVAPPLAEYVDPL